MKDCNEDAISLNDFNEFLNAKTFDEQLKILAIHSQKNQDYLKRRKQKMENKEKKENFFKKAFNDMVESAKAQHEVDKANLAATHAESKANFEENKGKNTLKRAKADAKEHWNDAHMSPTERQLKTREKQEKQILEANARKVAAEERIAKAKQERK